MEIQYQVWFGNRELDFCPSHFTRTKTACSEEARLWIQEKCLGRFCFFNNSLNNDELQLFILEEKFPAFEDPQEAILYELTWS